MQDAKPFAFRMHPNTTASTPAGRPKASAGSDGYIRKTTWVHIADAWSEWLQHRDQNGRDDHEACGSGVAPIGQSDEGKAEAGAEKDDGHGSGLLGGGASLAKCLHLSDQVRHGHASTGEVLQGLHEVDGNTSTTPLRNSRRGAVQVCGQCGAPPFFRVKPLVQVHG